jgi:hypothetical protein
MPGLDPGIHRSIELRQPWMAGSSPAMTMGGGIRFLPKVVMLGLDPGIHRSIALRQPWMAGSSPAMTMGGDIRFLPKGRHART